MNELPPVFDRLIVTAETVAQARPADVDLEMAREVFLEAATLLHNGLALDGLDDHDARAVVAGLCEDLVATDPGSAIRARARRTTENAEDLHASAKSPKNNLPRKSESQTTSLDLHHPDRRQRGIGSIGDPDPGGAGAVQRLDD